VLNLSSCRCGAAAGLAPYAYVGMCVEPVLLPSVVSQQGWLGRSWRSPPAPSLRGRPAWTTWSGLKVSLVIKRSRRSRDPFLAPCRWRCVTMCHGMRDGMPVPSALCHKIRTWTWSGVVPQNTYMTWSRPEGLEPRHLASQVLDVGPSPSVLGSSERGPAPRALPSPASNNGPPSCPQSPAVSPHDGRLYRRVTTQSLNPDLSLRHTIGTGSGYAHGTPLP